MKTRCFWVNQKNKLYVDYHDKEWGRPSRDDQHLFEMLILEGAQAGLSWETILRKRGNYRKAFVNFDAKKIARFDKSKVKKLMLDEGIVRNKLKIEATISNAKAFLEVQKEFGSFSKYLWSFVGGKPIRRSPKFKDDFIAHSPESDALSKDLKKRGFRFVGTTIIYAFMQATGMVDDHSVNCFRHKSP
jgi:DNA-3-methyladenine glycosylase I